ncbi:MAG: TatD family hydrolase [Planctomycetes bacterium]|nr:TatD family hydrolase [Planctomycetota bacterium]
MSMRIVSRLPSATELLCVIGCDDLPAVFRGTHLDPSRFVFHCFTGTPDEARRRLDFGAWTSFTRAVTFKKKSTDRRSGPARIGEPDHGGDGRARHEPGA